MARQCPSRSAAREQALTTPAACAPAAPTAASPLSRTQLSEGPLPTPKMGPWISCCMAGHEGLGKGGRKGSFRGMSRTNRCIAPAAESVQ